SFGDAPGGFSEEMKEINMSYGLEYWYNNLFAVRGGYFYENPLKGGRQYLTLGLGIRYSSFGLDFAYLAGLSLANPLNDTLRFTLHFAFEDTGKKEESIKE
ncbi:MAG: PorV/PorQ family protein, partial [Cytophagales bacterium]|nr:PorV/PorQ family protein [Cytophagales bacterium]